MNKLIINCIDDTKEFVFKSAKIYTTKYKAKLKSTAIHSVKAAKIITNNGNINSAFLLKMPIIYVESNGDIKVWCKSTIDEATLKVRYKSHKKEIRLKRIKKKLFHTKSSLGLTQKERIYNALLELDIELLTLSNSLGKKSKEGGGFYD